MAQNVGQFDLIIISDSGVPYLVKMKETPTGRVPDVVEKLDQVFVDVPNEMRDEGVTLAIMPDAPTPEDGCSCFLLNLQNIRNAIQPPADPVRRALRVAAKALRAGKTLTVPGDEGAAPQQLSARKL